jgi:hypothetical protein
MARKALASKAVAGLNPALKRRRERDGRSWLSLVLLILVTFSCGYLGCVILDARFIRSNEDA